MDYQKMLLKMCLWLYLVCFNFIGSDSAEKGVVVVRGRTIIGRIDNDFVCATLDWWPPQKCDFGKCSWDQASLLNLDLNNKILLNAVKAFSPLKLRLGGTLQDKVTYGTADNKQPCTPFVLKPNELFGFTQGCLPMKRWDELNSFFQKAGANIIFGLNALTGRSMNRSSTVAAWNYTNAESFIRYTVSKNYPIHGWELGNELSGKGIGISISPDQYAYDVSILRNIVQDAYREVVQKPLVIAPGGFFDEKWFKEFLSKSGKWPDVVTHHIYNLGSGADDRIPNKILDPTYLDGASGTFSSLKNVLQSSGTTAKPWVGEAGGAHSSGRHLVSDAFVNSFWYLDQLGMSATYGTSTYCRQTLIGGNYGLLNTTTFIPNPDYYSALIWHRLMGENVLSTTFYGREKIRAYAHCAKETNGITILFLNLDNNTTVEANVALHFGRKSFPPYKGIAQRREYHLTAKDGDIHSQTMLLNGNILSVNSAGDIPPLNPIYVDPTTPVTVSPLSIVFALIPEVDIKVCS